MLVIAWRFVTLLFAALALGMAFAHLLEMPPKLRYPASLWVTLQRSLYQAFAPAGAILETGAVVFAAVLAYLIRGRRLAFPLTVAGAACLAAALIVWLVFTAPANAQVNGGRPSRRRRTGRDGGTSGNTPTPPGLSCSCWGSARCSPPC
jgi:protein-S-isoprenylcysteine O-methyltransferase Ste14